MLSRVNNKKFWDDVDQRKIKVDLMKKKDKITKAPEMKIVKAMIGKDNEPLELELFKLLFPEQFQNILLGNKFEKTIPWKYKIPLEDLIVFFIHFEDILFLIDYFISRL
jgi:phosphate starvation-inducible membrane PsiE